MAGKAVDLRHLDPGAAQNACNRVAHIGAGKGRNGAVKDHAQTGIIDRPTHDIQCFGPGVLP